jgi:hypothetical protein
MVMMVMFLIGMTAMLMMMIRSEAAMTMVVIVMKMVMRRNRRRLENQRSASEYQDLRHRDLRQIVVQAPPHYSTVVVTW